MKRTLHWYDFLAINSYSLGLSAASGILTPLLLPYLIVLFMPPEEKTTHLATLRWVGLAVAMFTQPLFGMLSDRCTLRWGRRRPFIFIGALLNVLFLVVIGFAVNLKGVNEYIFGWPIAFVVLLVGSVLLSISSNMGQGALQGLIPDLVPEKQRGQASGFKSVLDLMPVFLVLFVGPLVDRGRTWAVVAVIMGGYLLTMLITVLFVREEPLTEKPPPLSGTAVWRLLALTVIFVSITRISVGLVRSSGNFLVRQEVPLGLQVAVMGAAGLAAMAGSIFLGVSFGARVGIGKDARHHSDFIWWVVNRLMFLAAIGSIQGFTQYYLRDVVKAPNPASMTTSLLAAVALFLIPAALFGGYLADRFGRMRLLTAAGFTAAAGTLLLLLSGTIIPLVLVSGAIIGLGTGIFYATNWALGTDLVPQQDAGKYLGISNLAGAGAGIVGASIGGPMADFFNRFSPGLGYLVIFSIYSVLFLLSVATLRYIKKGQG